MNPEVEELLEKSTGDLSRVKGQNHGLSATDNDRDLGYWLNVKPDKIGNPEIQDDIENLISGVKTPNYGNSIPDSSPKVADHRAEDTYTMIKVPEEELDTVYEAIEEEVEHLFALVTADSQYQSSVATYGFGESPEEEVCIADIFQINVGDSTSVNHPEHKIDALADMAREIDGEWYLGHNHPSGNPNPSEADRNSNQNYLGSLPGYSGKLIFVEDSNTEAGISVHPLDSFSEAEITDETYSNFGARMEYNRAENDRFGF